MILNSELLDTISGHLFKTIVIAMPEGRRVRIDAISHQMATAIAQRLKLALEDSSKFSGEDELVIGVISEIPAQELEVSTELAIGFRNRSKRLLIFVPVESGSAAQSLGANAFEIKTFNELLKEIIGEVKSELLSKPQTSSEVRSLLQNARDTNSLQSLAFFLELLSKGLHADLGKDLWKIGLIPDLGADPWLRTANNARQASMLVGNSRSMLTAQERVEQTRLANKNIGSGLERLIEENLGDLESTLERISEESKSDLSFEKWTYLDVPAEEIDSFTLVSFVDESGKVDPRCKLTLHSESEILYARNKVSIYWETTPSRINNLGGWSIELIPPSSIGLDLPTLRRVTVKAEKRMATIDIDLTEEETEGLYPRYVLRVAALDFGGNVVNMTDGQPAIGESQEFAIDIAAGGDPIATFERTSNATSLAEAYLMRVLDGKDTDNEFAPSWDLENQLFTISSSAFQKTNLRISRNVVKLQRILLGDTSRALVFEGKAIAGQVIDSFAAQGLELPAGLLAKRKKFLDLLKKSSKFRDTIETVPWTEAITDALDAYLTAFKSALGASSGSALENLLVMDTVSLSVQTPRGEVQGLLLLPTHPLRASWVQNHDRTLRTWGATLTSHAKKTRKMQVEAKLVSKLTAANLPLFVGSRGTSSSGDFGSFVYAEEFTHGSAFYIPAHVQDSRSYVMALSSALGLNVQTKSTNLSSTLLAERIANYASSRVSHAGLRIKAVNPADGLILADALRKATDYLPEGMKLGRLEVDSYSSFVPLVHPLPALEQFQKEIENTDGKATANYLAPSCSIKVSKISELAKSTVKGNLAIVQGLSQLHISSAANVQQKSSSLGGLLTSTSTQVVDSEDGKRTFTFPSLETLNSKKASAITLTHLAFEQGLIRALNLQPGNLAVALNLGSDSISVLEQLHSNNDWVCTLDRYLGLSLYEEVLTGQLQKTNILDYAPDFVDGIGDRLTVTTTDRDEISDVLLDAMDKLGLTDEKGKPEDLLRTLSSVSGRLALRLFKKDTIAMEAIGLAATVMHLRKEEKLKNVILFPVDAHPDLFGVHARDSQDSAQRCDLIVIGFSGKKYFLDFIEVKARSNAIEVGLEKKMASQIQQTIRVLSQRLGLGDTTRIDNELQWSRWAGLLHFYADRSHLHGFISKSEISNIHAAIDQIEKNKEKPEIRKSGYIFSLTSNKDSIQELVDGVRMTLLDAATVENLGFETKIGKSLINDVE